MDGVIADELQQEPVYWIKEQGKKEYLPVIFFISVQIDQREENDEARQRWIYLRWLFDAEYFDPVTAAVKKTAYPSDGIT